MEWLSTYKCLRAWRYMMSYKVHCRYCSAKFGSPNKSVECPSCGSTDEKDFFFVVSDEPEVPASTMMYEVKYKTDYGTFIQDVTDEVTQRRLDYMLENKGGHYKDLEVVRELGMTDTTWLTTWYKIGMKNHWIPSAYDPQFTMGSFSECKTLANLLSKLGGGGWCLGQAFYYRDLCFIQQVNGGDEWLIIKEDVSFESYSAGSVISNNEYKFVRDIYTYLNTPKDKLKRFEYDSKTAPEEIEIDGVIYRDEVKIRNERFKNIYKDITNMELEHLTDMVRRMEQIKDEPDRFVRYMKYKGYEVDIANFTVSLWYDKADIKNSFNDKGELDYKMFAFDVKSHEETATRVKMIYSMSDFIRNYNIDISWQFTK